MSIQNLGVAYYYFKTMQIQAKQFHNSFHTHSLSNLEHVKRSEHGIGLLIIVIRNWENINWITWRMKKKGKKKGTEEDEGERKDNALYNEKKIKINRL